MTYDLTNIPDLGQDVHCEPIFGEEGNLSGFHFFKVDKGYLDRDIQVTMTRIWFNPDYPQGFADSIARFGERMRERGAEMGKAEIRTALGL